ncbi:MAG: hypothetical protein KGL04_02285 [Elusimicrobia bacterium]|nr:hypothetical protein [Elusimicrobiota bacterium]
MGRFYWSDLMSNPAKEILPAESSPPARLISRVRRFSMTIDPQHRLKISQVKEGFVVKVVSDAKPIPLHFTFLFKADGTISLHETKEARQKTHRQVWKFNLNEVATQGQEFERDMKEFFQAHLQSMLSPNLTGTKLLMLPAYRKDVSDLVEMEGRVGIIQTDSFKSAYVIDPEKLGETTDQMFLVYKKARKYWHARGFLLKGPKDELRLLIGLEVIQRVWDMTIKMFPALPSGFANISTGMKFTARELNAIPRWNDFKAKGNSEDQVRARKRTALAALSAHVITQNFGKHLIRSEAPAPEPIASTIECKEPIHERR